MNTTLQPAAKPTIDTESAWAQVLARDPQATIFYAVLTTGVFCRPACTSRRPLRENVRFFASPGDAQAAGFRACLRCKPSAARGNSLDQVRKHLEANLDRRVGLDELGRVAGQSPFTVQRTFKQAMGVSPSQYQRALRAGSLRSELKNGASVTEAIYNAGFNSSSRAYEADPLGMTPAKFASGGRGERIGYATASSPFGWMIVGGTERGLCWLALADTEAAAEQTLRDEFPAAEIHRDPSLAELVIAALDSVREGRDLSETLSSKSALDLRGTVFQLRVWQALRQIPRGQTRSYSQLAADLGDANATRAVARACATNRVAILVPCHRVVGASGSLTGYRWGVERKRSLLEAEGIHSS
ncbi:bifunctional transcriptional activator/DNA repair enzyme AdaA [Occallatibacter riparius]|uniref:bifunctional transcriptional activator/DNA repair enzyme AdaA n=1 Tax=Occallatibacter riparius TaxID=1002689 RepID=UPI0028C39EFE|nr:methylated-DNA--[protein]-cysteine S-methyltransferase [Occallatibacter riparius]